MLGSLNRGGMETLLLDVFKNARIAGYSFIGIHRKGGKYQSEFYDTRLMEQCSPRRGNYIGYLLRLGHIIATRPGHKINNQLAQLIRKDIKLNNVQAPIYDPDRAQ